MICSKCGAPLPPGVSACPYCGAAVAGNAAPMQGEETAFAPASGDEYTAAMPQEPTEFAGGTGAYTAVAADEETEFAGAAPGYYGAAPEPAAAPAPTRKGKKKEPGPKKQKPAGKKVPVLRVVLIIILVLLIVVLVARPYIIEVVDTVFSTNYTLPPHELK